MKRMLPLVLCALPLISFAQAVDIVSSRLETRALRQEARALSRETRARVAPPPVAWDLSIGGAYTKSEDDSKTWSTPFLVKANFNDRVDYLKFVGDGYSRTRADSETASGFSDVDVGVGHAFYKSRGPDGVTKFSGELGYTIPSHTDVGSTSGKAKIGASYVGPLMKSWDILAIAKLARSDEQPPSGVSRFSRSGVLQAAYNFSDAPVTDVALQISRGYRPGAGGSSQAAVTFDLPITSQGADGWIGSIGYTRGLTSGSRDNTIEVDFSISF